jgi:hypothetical protein
MVKEKKELKTPYVSLWMEGNIIVGLYEEVHIDLAIAKEIVQERIRVFGTEERMAIIELRGAVSFTKEARDYLGSKEACVGVNKFALIANSPITITLGNFYLKITKPPVRTRIFSNKEDAKKWLMKN